MQEYHLNGTEVGSGTKVDMTLPGASSSFDGSKTTYDFSAVINYTEVSLTNAEIKALRATPVELVAAQGSGTVVELVSAQLKLNAGSEALTESADNLAIRYENGSGVTVSETIETTDFIDQTSDTYTNAVATADAIVAATGAENKALVLHNTGDGEIAGNASEDATLTVGIAYRVHSL